MALDLSKTLFENFAQTARAYAHEYAFTFLNAGSPATAYTYEHLFQRIDPIAEALKAYDLDPDVPIGILLPSQELQVLHYLAALSCGLTPAILTPPNRKLNRDYYLQTMRSVVSYCRFNALITDQEDLESAVTTLQPLTLRKMRAGPRYVAGGVAGAAFLQFSSGTTGIKRGVLVSEQAILEQLAAYAAAIGLTAHDRIVSWLPLYHDMGFIACLNLPLAVGAHTIMMHPIDWVSNPGMYLQGISRYRATLGWNPNFAYAFMAERVRKRDLVNIDLSSLRGLINCSEPVTQESQDRFRKAFAPFGLNQHVFWGCYAMAETVFALTHGVSEDAGYLDYEGPSQSARRTGSKPFVSVGRPLEGVELMIADQAGHPCADRQMGEFWVKSPFNLTGYYQNPEATRDVFHQQWYRTGDLGYRAGREFFVCGRKKDVLIIGGVNIHPQDIEDRIAQIEGIQKGRVAAFGVFDPVIQSQGVVVLAEPVDAAENAPKLMARIGQQITAGFQISNFEIHLVAPGWLVKSSAGKMARRANRLKWQRQSAGQHAHD